MNVSSICRGSCWSFVMLAMLSCSSPADPGAEDVGDADVIDVGENNPVPDAYAVTRITTAPSIALLDYLAHSGQALVMQRRADNRLEIMYFDGEARQPIFDADDSAFESTWHRAAPGWEHLFYSYHGPDAELRPELWRWSVAQERAEHLGKEVAVGDVRISQGGEWATFRRAIDGWGSTAGGELVSVRLEDAHTRVIARHVTSHNIRTDDTHTRIVAVGETDHDDAALVALTLDHDAPVHIADSVWYGAFEMAGTEVFYVRSDELYIWDFETETSRLLASNAWLPKGAMAPSQDRIAWLGDTASGEVLLKIRDVGEDTDKVVSTSAAEPIAFSANGRWLAHMDNAAGIDEPANLVIHDLNEESQYVLLTEVHVEELTIIGEANALRAVVRDGESRKTYLWSPSLENPLLVGADLDDEALWHAPQAQIWLAMTGSKDGAAQSELLWLNLITGDRETLTSDPLWHACLPLLSSTGERVIYGLGEESSSDITLMAWSKDTGSQEIGSARIDSTDCSGLWFDPTLEKVLVRHSTGGLSSWNGSTLTTLTEQSAPLTYAVNWDRSKVFFRADLETLSSQLHVWDFASETVVEVESGENASQVVASQTADSIAFMSLLLSTDPQDNCGGYSCDQRLHFISNSRTTTKPRLIARDADRVLALGEDYIFFITEEFEGKSLYLGRSRQDATSH